MRFRKPVDAAQSGEAVGLKLLRSVREMQARNFARTTQVRSRDAIGHTLNQGRSDAEH